MTVTIRRAGIADLKLLVEWRIEVLREVFFLPDDQSTEKLERANRSYFASAIPTEEHIACFADVDGETAGCGGMCLYREMPSPDNPHGRCAYLMNIYTRSAFRRRGVGEKIVAWLIDQARQKGIDKIYLESSAAARPLYRKMGFDDMRGYMMLE